jgi:hypothetical protein
MLLNGLNKQVLVEELVILVHKEILEKLERLVHKDQQEIRELEYLLEALLAKSWPRLMVLTMLLNGLIKQEEVEELVILVVKETLVILVLKEILEKLVRLVLKDQQEIQELECLLEAQLVKS